MLNRRPSMLLGVFLLAAGACGGGDSAIGPDVEQPDPNVPNPNTPGSGRYVHWTRYEKPTRDDRDREARLVKDGKIYSSPYSYSTDGGITWTITPSDGLNRQFVNLGGEFWVESRSASDGATVYTTLNGAQSLTIPRDLVLPVAWEGGSTAYAFMNNAGSNYGGHWQDDVVLRTIDGGVTWAPIAFPPPHNGQDGSLERIWLIDGKLYVLGWTWTPPDIASRRYQLHLSNGDSWTSSSIYSSALGLQKVTGHGIFARVNGGTFRLVVTGPSITLQALDMADDLRTSANISGTLLNAGGQLLLASEYTLFIPHPTTGRLFDPSPAEGDRALPGIAGIVLLGNELIVTRGWYVYKTPFPFVFHPDP